MANNNKNDKNKEDVRKLYFENPDKLIRRSRSFSNITTEDNEETKKPKVSLKCF